MQPKSKAPVICWDSKLVDLSLVQTDAKSDDDVFHVLQGRGFSLVFNLPATVT